MREELGIRRKGRKSIRKKVLIITDLAGKIVYVDGSIRVFCCPHIFLYRKNLFTDLITPESREKLEEEFDGQIMPEGQNHRHFELLIPNKRRRDSQIPESPVKVLEVQGWRGFFTFDKNIIRERNLMIHQRYAPGYELMQNHENLDQAIILEVTEGDQRRIKKTKKIQKPKRIVRINQVHSFIQRIPERDEQIFQDEP